MLTAHRLNVVNGLLLFKANGADIMVATAVEREVWRYRMSHVINSRGEETREGGFSIVGPTVQETTVNMVEMAHFGSTRGQGILEHQIGVRLEWGWK
ncbi:ANM_HP_G0101600.mRNA.1.CDS.1 [Saccharomyces cerevisiae]|nr:ANM_HP_G0101600.mRNA.1.CDS.1 [Saccharomyces cerevisiae]CAI6412897.1 ANM_HP_G0101600.mRNA.1.CDS.1 [Saccharomyces cerevisiae]